ncbi:ribonuclease H-like domain-containing protein [Tanacetum coccineum]|uniref:Ribonuclease H-like domain-containing protein n=1 Tax=Tanacetum coccineum TaxID=301880 RepID=A0ABQ4XPK7_9ASTR
MVLQDHEEIGEVPTEEAKFGDKEDWHQQGDVIKEPSVPVSAASTKVSTVIPTTAATTITAVSPRPRAKGIVFHEQEQEQEQASTPIVSSQQPTQVKDKDMDTELVKESFKKAKAEIAQESSSKRAGEALEQESSKKQKVDDDKETKELKQCMEIILDDGDDVTIEATPLSTKSSTIVDYKIHKEGKKIYFQIIQSKIFKKIEPVNYMDTFLHLNLKTMFEHHLEDNVWKNQQGLVKVLNWKLYDSCGVHYDLEVLDFDSLESHIEDILENARSKARRKLRKKAVSSSIRNNFYVGKEFPNRDVVKERITTYSVESRRNIDFKKNDKKRIKVTCKDTTVKIDVYSEEDPENTTRMFRRIYVCLGALKRGFKEGGRDLLGLDGAFMRG